SSSLCLGLGLVWTGGGAGGPGRPLLSHWTERRSVLQYKEKPILVSNLPPNAGGVLMRALLVPLDGSRSIELTKDLTLVGRKEDCDLRLDHKSVSKLHCVIVKTDGLLLLRDLGSTNSTRV